MIDRSTNINAALRSRQRGFLLNPFRFQAPAPSTPYEDFTTYTEVDPNSRISVTSSRVAVAAMPRGDVAYVYKDFGAGHFAGNFSIDFDLFSDSGASGSLWSPCMLANVVGVSASATDRLLVDCYSVGPRLIRIVESVGGSLSVDSALLNDDQTYYCRFTRDESVGTNGTAYLYLAGSDANRDAGVWIGTISLALNAKEDWRYLYFSNNLGSGGGSDVTTAYVENARINLP